MLRLSRDAGDDLAQALPIGPALLLVAGLPLLSQTRRAQVPVRPDLERDFAQVAPEVGGRGAAPKPIAVVHAVDDQPRFEDEGVRDHRVVLRIGVFSDIEVPLDLAPRVSEKGPVSTDAAPELVELEEVVR